MKAITGAIIAIVVLALGWFLVSPLFIDREVDESFDLVLADGSFNMDGVMAMPEAKRMAMKDEILAAAAGMQDKAMTEAMPATPSVVASGTFIDADAVHKGEGNAMLYALPNGGHVVRFEDFRVTNGPDLYVYLAKHPSPTTAEDVVDGGYLSLGKLKGNIGNQNYPLPDGTDVADYGSVVIWCQLFGVLFSPAALETGA
ncbi:MAG: DM13 domain-containing protein [Pseudomonadota bacterium]